MTRTIGCYRAQGERNDWRIFGSHPDGRRLTLAECKALCQQWIDSGEWNFIALMYMDSNRAIKYFRA